MSGFRLLGIACVGLLTAGAWAAKHEKTDAPAPSARIDTGPLDYHPLSSFYLMSRSSSSSLDFIDSEHLLFTFRATGLMKRLPDCQPDDEDQLIRALVVHLPDGKIERSAEWRMHDRGRYCGPGQWEIYGPAAGFAGDHRCEPGNASVPAVESPLRLVKLSPDGRLLLVETDLEKQTEDEYRRLAEAAGAEGFFGPREDVLLTVLRFSDRTSSSRRSLSVSDLPMISEGYIETLAARATTGCCATSLLAESLQ